MVSQFLSYKISISPSFQGCGSFLWFQGLQTPWKTHRLTLALLLYENPLKSSKEILATLPWIENLFKQINIKKVKLKNESLCKLQNI